MVKIDVLGSCVSRVIMLNGDTSAHGIADADMELGYFLDKENIACAMLKPPFTREEVEGIKADELYMPSRIHALKQGLNKDTVDLLLKSDAEYLIMDLYDFQTDKGVYQDTVFTTHAHEFFNTALFRQYAGKVGITNFMTLPTSAWYPLVDAFFDRIMTKYDGDHIILNRFRSNTWYLDKDGLIKQIPENFKQPYHSNDQYNIPLSVLENHIIAKYRPYVIDLSKYFMCDANKWDNLNGAHFEDAFYKRSFSQVKRIINGESTCRYYDDPGLFDQENVIPTEPFDVACGLEMFERLLDEGDILWMNILAKLNRYAGKNEKVKQYMEFLDDAMV